LTSLPRSSRRSPLKFEERAGHLPKFLREVIARLRTRPRGESPYLGRCENHPTGNILPTQRQFPAGEFDLLFQTSRHGIFQPPVI
jgi:hypothetical protein